MNLLDAMSQASAAVEGATDQLANALSGSLVAATLKTPVWDIRLAGKSLAPVLANRLISLTITDNRGFEADQCELVLDDADGRLDIPPRGARLTVAIGWKGKQLVDKGSYIVDEVAHDGTPDRLTIVARATDLRAGISTKKERSWHRTTLGKLVEHIAKENGLQPAIPAWLAKRPVEHIDQTSESDANLLTRLAEQHDAICTVKSGRLIFCKTGDAETVTGKPFPTVTITRASGDRHHWSAADRNAYTAVKAYWHNLDSALKGEVLVDANTKFERKATVSKRGRVSKRKKLTATQQKASEPSAANVKVLRHIYASEGTALQAAKAAWEKIQRGVAEFSIVLAEGRPELFPELPARVQGFKPLIDACGWTVGKVTHTLGDDGYITSLELEMKLEDLQG